MTTPNRRPLPQPVPAVPADATIDALWRSHLALEERVRALEAGRMRDLEARSAPVVAAPHPAPPEAAAEPLTLESFHAAERQSMLNALDEYKWNRSAAAEALGMPRRTFYRRLKEYGIE